MLLAKACRMAKHKASEEGPALGPSQCLDKDVDVGMGQNLGQNVDLHKGQNVKESKPGL